MPLEILNGQATAPSTTLTGLTMAGNDSLTLRDFPSNAKAFLLNMWATVQGAGHFVVRSPRMHDNVQGLRTPTVVSENMNLLPWGIYQHMFPQDNMVAQLSGSATAGDIESAAILIFYENLPGSMGRYQTWEQIKNKIINLVTVENDITAGTAGGYSGQEAITADFDLLKADTDYAFLGYECSVEVHSVNWRGTDTGNLRIGGPGNIENKQVTAGWFQNMSMKTGLPTIPILNSNNKSNTFIDVVNDENAAAPKVNMILGELESNL
jgi:hypothetical protein